MINYMLVLSDKKEPIVTDDGHTVFARVLAQLVTQEIAFQGVADKQKIEYSMNRWPELFKPDALERALKEMEKLGKQFDGSFDTEKKK